MTLSVKRKVVDSAHYIYEIFKNVKVIDAYGKDCVQFLDITDQEDHWQTLDNVVSFIVD